MATQSERHQSGSAFDHSDLVAQFRWFLLLIGGCLVIVVSGVVVDSVLGYPIFGGLIAAFGLVTSGLLLALGLVLLAYRID